MEDDRSEPPEPLFGLVHKGVDDMTMVEYMQASRMSESERQAFNKRYGAKVGSPSRIDLLFSGEDTYDAHSHHQEYGAARH